MEKISDLSTLRPNTIVRLTPVDGKCYGNPACFCIVKSVTKIPKKVLIKQYTFDRHKKVLAKNNYNYTQLELIEFKTGEAGSWDMIVPTNKSTRFISINDQSYEFELEKSSLDTVKTALAEAEIAELAEIEKSVEKQKEAIRQVYRNVLTNALEELVAVS